MKITSNIQNIAHKELPVYKTVAPKQKKLEEI
jgi:hypothetical protein